jgi:adhesin transport system membrane fusion protein
VGAVIPLRRPDPEDDPTGEVSAPLSAVRDVRTPTHARTLARLVVVVFALFLLLLLVPWQQTTRASGKVMAWHPNDRQQVVDAPVEGRVAKVLVTEGSYVREGDVLMELTDNDPEILRRLEEERDAFRVRADSARSAVLEMEGRVLDLQESRMRAVAGAEARVRTAIDRRLAADERITEMEAQLARDEAQLARREAGLAEGVASARDLEVALADRDRSVAQLAQAKAGAAAAKNEEQAAREELGRLAAEADANVASARNARDQAEMSEQAAIAELARTEVRVSRQETMMVKAPRDGLVLRVVANPGSELLKAGDPLIVLVPDTEERAVELWVDGRDVPFVRDQATVRLQFEGWPALQFVGIPGAASGTFGGRVALVDAAATDGTGKFRVLVVPDEDASWPGSDVLRQGNRVAGWVILGTAPLGYEIWRQVNGFPPVQSPDPKGGKGSEPSLGVERKKK